MQKKAFLHKEPAELIHDDSALTSLFIQQMIRNRSTDYIQHTENSPTGLPGPLSQGNNKIDQLLIGSVLEALKFHENYHVNSKDLKKELSITWQQTKENVRQCLTFTLYSQTPLPTEITLFRSFI